MPTRPVLDIDLADPVHFDQGIPHDLFEPIREAPGLVWNADGPHGSGFWVVTRHADVVEVSRDPVRFSSELGHIQIYDIDDDVRAARASMIDLDPPVHTRLRRLVSSAFTPRHVLERLEAITERVTRHLDAAVDRGRTDWTATVAEPIPIAVICDILGVPASDHAHLVELTDHLVEGTSAAPLAPDAYGNRRPLRELPFNSPAAHALDEYARSIRRDRVLHDRGDLLGLLARVEIDGERLTETEFARFFQLMVFAGNETTRSAMAHVAVLAARHADEMERLASDVELLDTAVEEVVRYSSPILHFRRTATTATTLSGTAVGPARRWSCGTQLPTSTPQPSGIPSASTWAAPAPGPRSATAVGASTTASARRSPASSCGSSSSTWSRVGSRSGSTARSPTCGRTSSTASPRSPCASGPDADGRRPDVHGAVPGRQTLTSDHREGTSTMTDIDAVATRLNEAGIHTVEIATPDIHAHMRGKRVPVRRFVESAAGGAVHMADAIYVLDYENDLVESPYINMGTGFLDCSLRADLGTLRLFGHRPGYAIVFADTFDENGDPHPLGPRHVLARQVAAAADAGYEVLAATELEAYLVTEDGDPVRSHIQYSSLTVDDDIEAVLLAMRRALAAVDIEVEGSNFEYGPGQIEINTGPTDPMTCADNTMLFKSVVRQVAEQHGMRATFMAKPWTEHSGNGLHTHTSLRRPGGSNAFADSDRAPNQLMAGWLGGLLHHAADMAMVGSPTPNGYKRIREYTFAPTHVHWGLDNRTVMARCICEPGSGANRVEFRSGGADANPYVMLAAVVAAGLDGIANGYPIAEMGTGDMYGDPRGAEPLPTDLGAAIGRFSSSRIAELLGERFSTNYALAAQTELDKYVTGSGASDPDDVTEWERDRYLLLA